MGKHSSTQLPVVPLELEQLLEIGVEVHRLELLQNYIPSPAIQERSRETGDPSGGW